MTKPTLKVDVPVHIIQWAERRVKPFIKEMLSFRHDLQRTIVDAYLQGVVDGAQVAQGRDLPHLRLDDDQD